jgi:putative ABC transport system permease protein
MIYRFKGHNNYPQKAAVRISPGHKAEAIKLVEQEFSKLFPGTAFEYNWVNEQFKSAYGEEEKLIKIIGIFSFFSLLLSILGVYALSVIVAANRIKEIGIRKVNGAKVFQIMKIMNKNFVEGIFIALVIAIPVSLIIVRKWLESFAYKTGLSWWIFLLAGLLALIVAVFAVTLQTWQAARKNPVEALRYE